MKKLFIITIITITLAPSIAQVQSDTIHKKSPQPDTSYLDLRKKQIIIIEKTPDEIAEYDKKKGKEADSTKMNFESYFGGMDLGLNTYLTDENSFTLSDEERYMELDDSKSLEFNLNLFDLAIPLKDNTIGIISGLGFSWNNYKFDNKQKILRNDSSVLYAEEISTSTYKKNKLTTIFLIAPIALEFHFPLDQKELWFLVGGYGGIKIGSHIKLVDGDGKSKIKEDFHLNTFRYGLRAQVGVDSFSLYGTYSLSTLFKKKEGPVLYPLNLGVSLAF